MKKKFTNLFSLIVSAILVFTMATCSFAEVNPTFGDSIPTVQMSLSGNYNSMKATFTWDTTFGGQYALRVWKDSPTCDDGNTLLNVENLTEGSYDLSGLENEHTYYYQLGKYVTDSYQYSAAASCNANFTYCSLRSNPKASFRRPAKKYGEASQSDNYIIIKWSKPTSSNYDRYLLYRDSTKVATVTSYSSYTNKNVVSGKHTYHIRAYFAGSDVYADFASNSITIKSHNRNAVKTQITWHAVMKKAATFYKKSKSSSKYGYIPKKKEVKTTGEKIPSHMEKVYSVPTRIQVVYNGKKGWIKWSHLNIKYYIARKSDYSISKKEEFVNSKNLPSSTKYLIWASRYTQRVNIFKGKNHNWTLYKVYDTNTGKFQKQTRGGVYKTKGHKAKVYRINQYGRAYYFRNSTSYGGSGTFHNIPRYVDNNSHNGSVIRKPNTGGCCRLHDSAASYIYKHIPLGTRVYIK